MSYLGENTLPSSAESSQSEDTEKWIVKTETDNIGNIAFGLSAAESKDQTRQKDAGGEKTKVTDADVVQLDIRDGACLDGTKSEKLMRTRSQTRKTSKKSDKKEALFKKVQMGIDGKPLGRAEKQPAVNRGRDNQRLQELVTSYERASRYLKIDIDRIAETLQDKNHDKKTAKGQKITLQSSLDCLKKIKGEIDNLCPSQELDDDADHLATAVSHLLVDYRRLYPRGQSDMSSDLTSSYAYSDVSRVSLRMMGEAVQKQRMIADEKVSQLDNKNQILSGLKGQKVEIERRRKATQREVESLVEAEREAAERLKEEGEKRQRQADKTARRLKEQMEKEFEEKLEQLETQIEAEEQEIMRINRMFDRKSQEVAEQMLAEARDTPEPLPNLANMSLLDVHHQGVGILQPLRDQVLDDERRRSEARLSDHKMSVQEDPQLFRPASQSQFTSTQSHPYESYSQPHTTPVFTQESHVTFSASIVPTITAQTRQPAVQGAESNQPTLPAVDDSRQRWHEMSLRRNIANTTTMTSLTTVTSTISSSRYQSQYRQLPQSHQEEYPIMSSSPAQYVYSYDLNPSAEIFQPRNGASDARFETTAPHEQLQNSSLLGISSHQEEIKVLVDAVKQNRLPLQEPTVFSGDPIAYPAWRHTFLLLIASQNITDTQRLMYLQKYVSGAAKEAISGTLLSANDKAYQTAFSALEQRFGSPLVVTNAFRTKYESWPHIKSRDGEGLRRLSDFLHQCESASKLVGQQGIFEDFQYQLKMVEKLPDWMALRWKRRCTEKRRKEQRHPSFSEFVQFVFDEAEVACEPGWDLKSTQKSTDPVKCKSQTSYATSVVPQLSQEVVHNYREDMKSLEKTLEKNLKEIQGVLERTLKPQKNGFQGGGEQGNNRKPCEHCQDDDHHVANCPELMSKPRENRLQILKEKKLCFKCGNRSHVASACQRPKICRVCKSPHLTILHYEKNDNPAPAKQSEGSVNVPQKEAQVQQGNQKTSGSHYTGVIERTDCRATQQQSSNFPSCQPTRTTMIIPVYVSSADEPEREILTYALLDTQSYVSFIANELMKKLNARCEDLCLKLNTMTAQNKIVPTKAVKGLRVRPVDSRDCYPLAITYTTDFMSVDPRTIPTPEVAMRHEHLKGIADQLLSYDKNCIAGLLIGYDNSQTLMPTEVIHGTPFGVKTCLGWTIVGESTVTESVDDQTSSPSSKTTNVLVASVSGQLSEDYQLTEVPVVHVYQSRVDQATVQDVLKVLEGDFIEKDTGTLSQDDLKFLDIIGNGIRLNELGHYEMPLPFRDKNPVLPNNRSSAFTRAMGLKRQLEKDPVKREHYMKFMKDLLDKGHAERVPEDELDKPAKWYIPHHGVYNEKKPGKIRVVFDCSARFQGVCINDMLLQGPDLINSLVGVLLRFRKGKIALSCDIQQMYHQFHVCPSHRDYLRFLWWEDGDLNKPLKDFRMTVHIFGAASSPGCANYGLKQAGRDHAYIDEDAAQFLQQNFYVDDGLHASDDVETAARVLKGAVKICQEVQMRLHKITSNSKELLDMFPEEEQAERKPQDLGKPGEGPVERVLGLQWLTEEDVFTFTQSIKSKPATRRGMLSTVAALYDPLGFISPLVLRGRILLHQACRDHLEWDDPLPAEMEAAWTRWLNDLTALHELKVPRSFIPPSFGTVLETELHHFSDASADGYGQCSYLRLVDQDGRVHCSLAMAKSRVTPMKKTTIPRLELQAATLSVRISIFLDKQLKYDGLKHHFWTDSKIVLAYLANHHSKFHVFVANRVGEILRQSELSQWSYIPTGLNPADIASRGATAPELQKSVWFHGPEILWRQQVTYNSKKFGIPDDDAEVHVRATTTSSAPAHVEDQMCRATTWPGLVNGISRVMKRWVKKYRESDMSLLEMRAIVKIKLIAIAQREHLSNPVPSVLNTMKQLGCCTSRDGLIVVGGRVKKKDDVSLPVLLPRDAHLTKLIVRRCHEETGHAGRTTTIYAIRKQGYWIIGVRRVVSQILKSCVPCIRHYGAPMGQKMADLPIERTTVSPPFSYCGIDCFGPFLVKDGRKMLKRYALLITCFASRAVHIEILDDMTTDCFIDALRRVVAIRGPIRQIRSDRGTNFVGASRELKRAWEEMPKDDLKTALLGKFQCEWQFNPPSASHTGGVWERLIRSARRILNGLLTSPGVTLTTSSLRTLLYEVMAVMNSRPLSVESLEDPTGPLPLTPNHILTMKTPGMLPPPGVFEREDVYLKKRWRQVQYLADVFWERWRNDYLVTLQSKRKWQCERPNLAPGDVVLLVEDGVCRGDWKLARIEKVYASDDGLVRRCLLRVAKPTHVPGDDLGAKPTTMLERPVTKLVLLVKGDESSLRQ